MYERIVVPSTVVTTWCQTSVARSARSPPKTYLGVAPLYVRYRINPVVSMGIGVVVTVDDLVDTIMPSVSPVVELQWKIRA